MADIAHKRLTGVYDDYLTSIKEHVGRRLGEKDRDIFLWFRRCATHAVVFPLYFCRDERISTMIMKIRLREKQRLKHEADRSSHVFLIYAVAA